MNNWRRTAITWIVVIPAMSVLVSRGANGQERSQSRVSGDELAIRAILDNQVRAWDAGDAVAHARDVAEDGIFTNILGQSFIGREAFVKQHEVIFRELFKGTIAQGDVTVLRFPAPNVALVETLTAVSGLTRMPPGVAPDASGRLRTRLLQVLVRLDEGWKVVAYHNVDVKAIVPLPDPGVK